MKHSSAGKDVKAYSFNLEKCKEADELIDRDDIITKEVRALSQEIDKLSSTIESLKKREDVNIGLSSLGFAAKASAEILDVVTCAKAIKSITTTSQIIDGIVDATKVAAIAGSKTATVFAAFGIALSIGEIAWYSSRIHQKQKSEAGKSFIKIVGNLAQQIEKIREFQDPSRRRSNSI